MSHWFVCYRSIPMAMSGSTSCGRGLNLKGDVKGHGTKSLRSSPLRGGKSREALNQPKGRQ